MTAVGSFQGVGVGTAFPAQPDYGNDRPFYRSDRNRLYFYDGTRWLSVEQHRVELSTVSPYIPVTGMAALGVLWGADHAVWANKFYVSPLVVTTNNGSNFWTIYLYSLPSGTIIAQVDTSANAPDLHVAMEDSMEAALISTDRTLSVYTVTTGSPGALLVPSAMTHRLIG